MSNIGFDPKGFYEFDLARGAVSTRGGARVIVLSDTVVASLVSAAVETGDLTVLRELGKQIGAYTLSSTAPDGTAATAPVANIGAPSCDRSPIPGRSPRRSGRRRGVHESLPIDDSPTPRSPRPYCPRTR